MAVLLATAFVITATVGCGSGEQSLSSETSATGDDERSDSPTGDLEMYRFESLEDWVTYADEVAEFEVVSEAAVPDEYPDRPEGNILRSLEVRVLAHPWSRLANPAPDQLTIVTDGWWKKDFGRTTIPVSHGDLRFEVGGRYFAALILDPRGGEAFGAEGDVYSTFTGSSIFEIVDDRLVTPSGTPSGGAATLSGMRVEEVGEVLASVRPYPESIPFADLPTIDRYIQTETARAQDETSETTS